MKVAFAFRLILIVLAAAGPAAALPLAAALGQFIRSDGQAQYPNSRRVEDTHFSFDWRGRPALGQSSLYHSPDNSA